MSIEDSSPVTDGRRAKNNTLLEVNKLRPDQTKTHLLARTPGLLKSHLGGSFRRAIRRLYLPENYL